jgi:DNA mismatch repair protein MutL
METKERAAGLEKRKVAVMPGVLIDQIAAGEVVDRPSSVVKELVENALDAGAKDIAVEIEKGGTQSVRVTDDGWGMNREDAVLAFERHATSKLYAADEMLRIRSFGFRGEALPSIAAVSRVEMITRERGALSGTRILIEGGVFREVAETGASEGTTIRASDLFYSVPARRKFLKKESAEQAHCLETVTRLSLCHPEVRFTFIAGGRKLLYLPGGTSLGERLSLLFGRDFHEKHVPFRGGDGDLRVSGYVSLPGHTRSTSRAMYYTVNDRPVRDTLLGGAVFGAMRNRIEPRRYPSVLLFVSLPPEDVDVNVHPAKLEVRFREPRRVYQAVFEALSTAMSRLAPPGRPSFPAGEEPAVGAGEAAAPRDRVLEAARRYTLRARPEPGLFTTRQGRPGGDGAIPVERIFPPAKAREGAGGEAAGPEIPFPEDGIRGPAGTAPAGEWEEPAGTPGYSSMRYLGRYGGIYLILLSSEGVVFLDQHAAHERILFEKLKNGRGKKGEIQELLLPEVVFLTPGQFGVFENAAGALAELGFSAEPYGGTTVLLRSCPRILSPGAAAGILPDLLDDLSENRKAESLASVEERCLRFIACRGAVKAGDPLGEEEVRALLGELDRTPSASTCPHGRPLSVSLGRRDLERMFRR